MPRFEPLWVEVGGVPIHAVACREADPAPPVVLVHGLGLSHRYMMPVARHLARWFPVYVPDQPGFGDSGDASGILTVAGLADALAAWSEAASLPPAAYLGNSFGCQVIVELAARHPERVTRAVLQGPTTPPEERTWLRQAIRWRQNRNPRKMGAIAREDYRRAGLRRILVTFERSLRHPVEERLDRVRCPTLVVRGSRDPICRHGWAEEVARRLPDGRLVVIPGVRHTLVFTAPLELARVCRPFLEGRAPAAAPPPPARPEPPGRRGRTPRGGRRPRYVAGFDSATGMHGALARFLHGRDFPNLGLFPRPLEAPLALYGAAVDALPPWARRQVYIWSGWGSAVPPDELRKVRADEVARWMAERYPRRRYPAVAVGSSNGALVHLCAALGVPWLPQTFLVPVRRSGGDPDDSRGDMEWARGPAERLLGSNPDLQLHHMHDPVQDRLMVRRMTYFRVKHLRLPESWRRFLVERLEPGGTLVVVDCALRWPTTRVAERHLFQHGALGGIEPEEYFEAGARVTEFLAREGAEHRRWDPPEPDGDGPEAEWGFAPELADDLEELANRHGWRLRRLRFDHPERLSPLVADLYAGWYRRRGIRGRRLVVDSFILMEPWWTLRCGAVPFWTVFPTEPSAEALQAFLEERETCWDDAAVMLFSHGVPSAGLAPAERWAELAARHARRGGLLGVSPDVFPQDFAAFVRYHRDLPRRFPSRYPVTPRLTLAEVERFLAESTGRYGVEWR